MESRKWGHDGLAKRRAYLALVLLSASVGSLQAQDATGLESELNTSYRDKVVVLREFCSGERLTFNTDGSLIRGGSPGSWGLDGHVGISRLTLHRGSIEIEGHRIYFAWNAENNQLEVLPAGLVRIMILTGQDEVTPSKAQDLLAHVFLPAEAGDPVPPYWKPILDGKSQPQAVDLEQSGAVNGQPVYSVGTKANVTPPRPISTRDPEYTREATNARFEGVLVFEVVVDSGGKVFDGMAIGKPGGLGLEQKGIEALRKWKFKPATKNGVPAQVRARVEITFHPPI